MAFVVGTASKIVACLLTGALVPAVRPHEGLDGALARGSRWLADRQDEHGAVAPAARPALGDLLTTATALWAAAVADRPEFPLQARLRAVGYLAHFRHDDGSYRDERGGLAAYTTGVVCCALREANRGVSSRQLEQFASAGESYVAQVYFESAVESGVDRLASRRDDLSPASNRAVRFLAAVDRHEGSQPAVVPLFTFTRVPRVSEGGDARMARALESARAHYPNGDPLVSIPEITEHYAESRLLPEFEGALFGAFVLARTLAWGGDVTFVDPDGVPHEWTREISDRLLETQRPDGSWIEPSGDSAGEPVLSTAYALLALATCRDAERALTDR